MKTEYQLQRYEHQSLQYKQQLKALAKQNSVLLISGILSFFFIGWAAGKTLPSSSFKHLIKKIPFILIQLSIDAALIKPLRALLLPQSK